MRSRLLDNFSHPVSWYKDSLLEYTVNPVTIRAASSCNFSNLSLWTDTEPYENYCLTILLLLNEITYKKVHLHFMQVCLAITPTYIPQVNKYSFRRIYSVEPVGFLNGAQFAILVQRFSNVSLDNLKWLRHSSGIYRYAILIVSFNSCYFAPPV